MNGLRQQKSNNFVETAMKGRVILCGEYAAGLYRITSLYTFSYVSKTYSTKLRHFVTLKLSGFIVLAECLW